MPYHAAPEGTEVVPPFQRADDPALGVNVGGLREQSGHLLERFLAEVDLGPLT